MKTATLESALEERDRVLATVGSSDPEWALEAREALVTYLRKHATFFVDDFWERSGLRFPAEGRAFGAVVQWAARQGLMQRSGTSRPSARSHGSDKPVWTSLLYRSRRKVPVAA